MPHDVAVCEADKPNLDWVDAGFQTDVDPASGLPIALDQVPLD